MGELSLDITEEILVRLKAKDLVLYKSVCKSWYSLISSRRFVDSHLNYNLKKQADNNEIGHTRIVLTGRSRHDYTCGIVGSSNGLVCVRFSTELLVVNPSTRELIKLISLPKFPHVPFPMGFGYDSSIDDYKVVFGFINTHTYKYRFLVLTLRLNVWKSVPVELDYRLMYNHGFLCNGAIHWLAIEENNTYHPLIVSFDLSKEVFKEFPSPVPLDNFPPYKRLGVIKDRLCFFCGSSMWVMNNYNVQESESIWEQILPPPPYDDCPHQTYIPPKSLSGHIHIWMLEESSSAPVLVQRVKSSYGNTNHIRLSTTSECNYKYDEHVFVESLVSPCGMSNENGNCNDERVTMAKGGDSSQKKECFHWAFRGYACTGMYVFGLSLLVFSFIYHKHL